MKTRVGFVSNSSSSSFIIQFPRIPKDLQDLKDMLFTPFQQLKGVSVRDEHATANQLAEIVLKDIEDQKETASKENIEEFFEINDYGYHVGTATGKLNYCNTPRRKNYESDEKFHEAYDAYQIERKEIQKRLEDVGLTKLEDWQTNHPEGFVLIAYYSDSDGTPYYVLENGNVFRNIEHIYLETH